MANPEDRFSHDVAQFWKCLIVAVLVFFSLNPFPVVS